MISRGRLKRWWTHFFGYEMKLSSFHVNKLKADIRKRLATEDYTCRLPRDPKPRVRYKLRTFRHATFSKTKVWR